MPFWDTHFHVFTNELPMVSDRRYAPEYAATPAQHQRLMTTAGLAAGIIIQPSFLGTDNSYMLDAINAFPSLRGVAVVDPAIPLEELKSLKAGGIVGIRFNLVGKDLPDFSEKKYQTLFSHIRSLDWHVEIHRAARDYPEFMPALINAGVRVVIDHFGLPDPVNSFEDPGFKYILSLGDNKQVWVKISAPYRTQKENLGLEFAKKAAPMLIEHFGAENILWGSDWPHTRFEGTANYAALYAAFEKYVPSEETRELILKEAPRRLIMCSSSDLIAGAKSETTS